ncbi:pectate lyase [Marinimicrobium alkaliphilum]|uniref:pectate lyase n=1 Tax=Marinimicrobium alkaliphilum TaxID=2202654 RepID=UPI000DB99197|nr:pectate lyase [Marinimicrobium alkaliphilum]
MKILLSTLAVAVVAGGLSACQPSATAPSAPSEAHSHGVNADSAAWQAYLERSEHWASIDRDYIEAELAALGWEEQAIPTRANRFGFNVHPDLDWFNTDEGRRIMNNVLSFQTPSGGWSKRTDMSERPRQPGEAFGNEPKYVPTFDNDATFAPMRLLGRAHHATGSEKYAEAFIRGLNLVINAQYPNGCWPQIYPLHGGYHDHITFNDETVENNIHMLTWAIEGGDDAPFDFVSDELVERARVARQKGFECITNSQVVVDGEATIWAAQYNRYTLEPDWARAFEPPSLATGESGSLLIFLMGLDEVPEHLVPVIHDAVAWFDAHKIEGYEWDRRERVVRANPNAEPIWGRFIEVPSMRPIFGDRDGSINYDVMDISEERRRGFGWYTDNGNEVLALYPEWRERFPDPRE